MTLDEQLAMADNAVAIQPNNVQATPVQNTQPQQEVTTTQVAQPVPTQGVYHNNVTPGAYQNNIPAQMQQAPMSAPQGIDLNAAAEEAEVSYAAQEIELGQKISTRAIEGLKRMNQGDKIRITPLVKNPFSVKIHNHEDLGKILCWSSPTKMGQCCKDLDQPKVRYCIPVLVYGTLPNDPTQPLPQVKSELRLLQIWDISAYDEYCQEIINYSSPDGTLPDLIATCDDTWGRLSFRAQQTSFRTMPEYQQYLNDALAAWQSIGIDKALPTIGRKLDDTRYLKLTQKASVPTMQTYSMEDAMN